jgi:hypothetical protein
MQFSPFTQIPYEANGNISPRRFITGVAGSAQKAVQAVGVTLPILGVSYDKLRFPPNSPSDDGFNAIAGEPLSFHRHGEVASVDTGAAITDLTVPLTSDGSGKAIPVTMVGNTALTWVGGLPVDICANGEVCRVFILPPWAFHPTLS